eukprot:1467782-Prymnesium_polylepis.1
MPARRSSTAKRADLTCRADLTRVSRACYCSNPTVFFASLKARLAARAAARSLDGSRRQIANGRSAVRGVWCPAGWQPRLTACRGVVVQGR